MQRPTSRGFTLLEALVAATATAGLLSLAISFQLGMQESFAKSSSLSVLRKRASEAADELAADIAKAQVDPYSGDSLLATVGAGRGLRFREIVGGDSSGPQFGAMRYYLGPHSDTSLPACAGVVLLRHSTLPGIGADFSSLLPFSGSDGIFGTVGDMETLFEDATASPPIPQDWATHVIVPSLYAPSTGAMLEFTPDPVSGRTISFTLRLNLSRVEPGVGAVFAFGQDVVVTRDVTLLQ